MLAALQGFELNVEKGACQVAHSDSAHMLMLSSCHDYRHNVAR